ncbi:MAG: type II toxin-antitoxin system RelE/ParE family toxin [Sedimentisphaerales bacterium]|nr:type II toxin-antitoxin system RelE/ParE family toxin [Sedimentisphaerales bacterium]
MRIEVLDTAKQEFAEAIAYYNRESEGLGYRFAAEVRKTLLRILRHPRAWTPISNRARRCRTSGFPYGVIYQIRDNVILVVAIMHLHRHPDSWKARLPSQ